MSVAAVIVAAGSGERLGAGVPKALVSLHGQPLLHWAVLAFFEHPDIDEVVVVAPPSFVADVATTVGPRGQVVPGGDTRQRSVDRGLAALTQESEFVLIHDAARPIVSKSVVSSVVGALRNGADAVIPVMPVTDTIKRVDAAGEVHGTVDRTELRAVQTPQGFRRTVLVEAHAQAVALGVESITDDAGLVEAMGLPVLTVPGSPDTFKITTPHDLRRAERSGFAE